MSKIRTFIATPVIDLIALKTWFADLKKQPFSEKIKWNDPDLWHLTFKFIGNVEKSQLKMLIDSLKQALEGFERGNLKFEGAGYFGSSKAPKVIWAGIREDEWLEEMKKQIEGGVLVLELPEENRPFHPHLTLGRVKYLRNKDALIQALSLKEKFEWGNFEVNRIVLYKSKLTSSGPEYSELESFGLK